MSCELAVIGRAGTIPNAKKRLRTLKDMLLSGRESVLAIELFQILKQLAF